MFDKYKNIVIFYLLACLISWGIWILMNSQVNVNSNFVILHFIGSLGPAIACLVLVFFFSKPETKADFINSISFKKEQFTNYLFWFVLPFVFFFAGLLIEIFVFKNNYDFSLFLGTKEFPNLGIGYWICAIIFYGFGEEIGWRGYLLPNLRKIGFSSKVSAIIMTPLWAIWHIPLFFYINSSYKNMDFSIALGWLFSLLLGSVLLNYIFYQTKKSLIAVAVFHAALDIAIINLLAEKAVFSSIIVNVFIMILGVICLFVRHKD